MPAGDAAVVHDAASAAPYSGMAPGALEACRTGGDAYGLVFPATSTNGDREQTVNESSGCDHRRSAARRGELPLYGMSDVSRLIVRRCPVCATFRLETERWIHPVSDDGAAEQPPDAVRGA